MYRTKHLTVIICCSFIVLLICSAYSCSSIDIAVSNHLNCELTHIPRSNFASVSISFPLHCSVNTVCVLVWALLNFIQTSLHRKISTVYILCQPTLFVTWFMQKVYNVTMLVHLSHWISVSLCMTFFLLFWSAVQLLFVYIVIIHEHLILNSPVILFSTRLYDNRQLFWGSRLAGRPDFDKRLEARIYMYMYVHPNTKFHCYYCSYCSSNIHQRLYRYNNRIRCNSIITETSNNDLVIKAIDKCFQCIDCIYMYSVIIN